jgi:hypothetical protein
MTDKTTKALKLAEEYLTGTKTLLNVPSSRVVAVVSAIREALAEQEKQEPVEYMFNVEVEGKANAVFDTADEAVRFSMHHVYLSSGRTQQAIDTLNQGQVFMYSYGFSGVNIVPVAKRKMNAAPVDAKAIRAEALEEAAKVCEEGTALTYFQNTDCYNYAHNRAKAIRSLK